MESKREYLCGERTTLMKQISIVILALTATLSLGSIDSKGQTLALVDYDDSMPIVELESTETSVPEGKQSAGLFAYATERADGPLVGGSGRSRVLDDGTQIWEVGYRSPGALSMSVTLGEVSLPEGGSLTVCGRGGTEASQVAVTEGNMGLGLGSPIVSGEVVVVQYIGPSVPAPSFVVTSVCRGFREVDWQETLVRGGKKAKAGEYGSSKECEVVAACNTSLTKQRRSICRLIINNNMIGTGTLINNTSGDGAPYVLTSAHVIPSLPITACKARFCFEETTCGGTWYNLYSQEISGATLVSYDERSDMALLRLSEVPSVASHPYWAGWNISDKPIGLFTCYHHPYGDAKKVSTAPGVSTASYTLDNTNNGNSFRTMFHWLVPQWTSGATEGGSSGSPLMDKDGLVVGGLTGGQSSCTSQKNDYFWQLCRAWTLSGTSDYIAISEALDPTHSGVTSLEGADLTDGAGTTPYEELATYTTSSEPLEMDQKLTPTNTRIVQRMENPHNEISISCVVLSTASASIADKTANGPVVSLSIVKDGTGETIGGDATVSKLCNVFNTDRVGEFVFDPPVTIDTSAFAIVLEVEGMGEDDYLAPLSVVTEDGGQDMMVSVYYKTTGPVVDSIKDAEKERTPIRFRRMDRVIAVEGDRLSDYSVWSIDGKMVSNCEDLNASATMISTDGWAVGLYLLIVSDSNGNKAKIRFLVK